MKQQAEIIEEIAKQLGVTPQDIDPQASLRDDLGLGPVEVSDLMAALAERFQVTFDPADTEQIHTVSDLIVTIEDLMLE